VFIGGPDYPAEYYGESQHPQNKSHVRSRSEFDMLLMREALKFDLPSSGLSASWDSPATGTVISIVQFAKPL
ncbi:MAG: gamma-glutamyl-gamma-aminobutyrate hydrolase family protein, partial [Victivallales bacterium]|nr:gamma-glutamyl-gamma-aminobutyrate hydrolase family protein [Victivallales bacterium]